MTMNGMGLKGVCKSKGAGVRLDSQAWSGGAVSPLRECPSVLVVHYTLTYCLFRSYVMTLSLLPLLGPAMAG
jgi:hypothetical protein